MKTALLIVLLSLSSARKEAAKRWPAGTFSLRVDQTTPKYRYELTVTVVHVRQLLMSRYCAAETKTFTGEGWQAVMSMSKEWKSDGCVVGSFGSVQ